MRNIYDSELRTCDRSGFDYKKSKLKKQKGLWVSPDSFDSPDPRKSPNIRWGSTRSGSNTTDTPQGSVPEVYTFSSVSGINLLTQSHELSERRDGRHKSIFMKVQSDGGNISISANPQVTAGTFQGDLLTLKGCSATDTITLVDGNGLRLFGSDVGGGGAGGVPFTLGESDTISFVYTTAVIGWGDMQWGSEPWGGGSGEVEVWKETSRFKGGV